MSREKEITIYDIARELDLSAATVSRGLKDHPAINKQTKKKIADLATKLGYRSNNFASNLRKQRTNTIGVIVHELNSQFITSVLAGIEKVTTEANYDLIIGHSSETFKKEAANAMNLFHKRVDGLIASLAYDTEDLSHFEPFAKKGIPVMFFDRVFEQSETTKVVINNYKAGYEATAHLAAQGCKRIAHITANLKRNVYAERLNGYRQALLDNRLSYDEKRVLVNDLSEEASAKAARQVLAMKPMPDGVFITNDFCAAVCMQVFKDAGKRIPQDIAVVGFNNDAICKIVEPKLTTVNYPGIEMGEIVARNLINHLHGVSNIHLTNTIIIKSELIIRESSMKKQT
ncbi:LacI family DNA-binding transcriptional regulator [Sediminibacterium soli]|uniref:LacI family DNA-binding transcriptional regulator n=1 Tax=Sediminibacterium soli TaxID=2698829 RepID=UPI00137AC5AB|nr:LacI family DNA-binding transcriptional regulator [Sediminibacterium soli]NCI45738.1 LacI family transcriptional regulator [Sediminibacterium soli]